MNMQQEETQESISVLDATEQLAGNMEEETQESISVLDATEQLAGDLMRISKKTKMSESGVKDIYSFFYQQVEMERQRSARPSQPSGQDLIDAIAQEQADAAAHETLNAEVITSDD